MSQSSGYYTKTIEIVEYLVNETIEFKIRAVIGIQYPMGRGAPSDLDYEGYVELDEYRVIAAGVNITAQMGTKALRCIQEAIKDAVMNDPEIPNLQFWGW